MRATYMRGGASKGLFFLEQDLPCRRDAREQMFLRLLAGADAFENPSPGLHRSLDNRQGFEVQPEVHCKIGILSPSKRDDCDVEFLYGAVASNGSQIDYSGCCSSLAAAVGPFALHEGLVKPRDGMTLVKIWQVNLGRRIDAYVPVQLGKVLETGLFQEQGLGIRGAEIRLEWIEPQDQTQATLLLPTGNTTDELEIPGLGPLRVSLLQLRGRTGFEHTAFFRAEALKLNAQEEPETFQRSRGKRAMLEKVRCQAARLLAQSGRGGLPAKSSILETITPECIGPENSNLESLATEQIALKIAMGLRLIWVNTPDGSRLSAASSRALQESARYGEVALDHCDVLARVSSRGKLQASMGDESAIAVAAAAALPGSIVHEITRTLPGVATRIGDVSGTLAVGAELSCFEGRWRMDKAVLSRSARRLMSGQLFWPEGEECV